MPVDTLLRFMGCQALFRERKQVSAELLDRKINSNTPHIQVDASTQTRLAYEPLAPDPMDVDQFSDVFLDRLATRTHHQRKHRRRHGNLQSTPSTQGVLPTPSRPPLEPNDYFAIESFRKERGESDSIKTPREMNWRSIYANQSPGTAPHFSNSVGGTSSTSGLHHDRKDAHEDLSPGKDPALRLGESRMAGHRERASEDASAGVGTSEGLQSPSTMSLSSSRELTQPTQSATQIAPTTNVQPRWLHTFGNRARVQDRDSQRDARSPAPRRRSSLFVPIFRVPLNQDSNVDMSLRDLPDHLKTSPLCPANPLHPAGGRKVCPLHGPPSISGSSEGSLLSDTPQQSFRRVAVSLDEFLASNKAERA